ncbi:MAG: uncharacterized protein JWM34_2040 [Ilumatobacteraceae bacterium]|nr:uncharacterized protein [Ilumatobacteraceae bacterium]
MTPQPWTVTARNLPEHAINPIHTDDGARAVGFPRALIAGVTTYAYLTHPIMEAWGIDWLESGGGEVRFKSPVFLDDEVVCRPEPFGDEALVSALVGEETRALFRAIPDSGPAPASRDGEVLKPRRIHLEGEFSDEYGVRAGDDLDTYARRGLVHPAVWPALANHLVHTQVARGSWIHTHSVIRHHALVPVGSYADVTGVVVRRVDSSAGERAVLDVRIEVEDRVVASLEHHAVVDVTVRRSPD